MARLGKRVARLARGYYDQLRKDDPFGSLDSVGEARADAEQELAEALKPDHPIQGAGETSAVGGRPSAAEDPPNSELRTPHSEAYRVLGLPEGTDFIIVRRQYNQLITKVDPSRFPEGSDERAKAEALRSQIEGAYITLLKQHDTSSERFNDIEVG